MLGGSTTQEVRDRGKEIKQQILIVKITIFTSKKLSQVNKEKASNSLELENRYE